MAKRDTPGRLRLGARPLAVLGAMLSTGPALTTLLVSADNFQYSMINLAEFALINTFCLYFFFCFCVIGHEIVNDCWISRELYFRLFYVQKKIPLRSIIALRRGVGFRDRPFDAVFVDYDQKGRRRTLVIVLEAYSGASLDGFFAVLRFHRPDLVVPTLA